MSGSDLYSAIKSMVNNKSPGNDGLTKAFMKHVWIKSLIYFTNP